MSIAKEIAESLQNIGEEFGIEVGDTLDFDGQEVEVVDYDDETGELTLEGEDGEGFVVNIEDLDVEVEASDEDFEAHNAFEGVDCDDDEEEEEDDASEARKVKAGWVIRDGQKVKVKAHTVKKMKGAQLQAIRKAARKRKGKKLKASTLRARAKSLKLRKRVVKQPQA